ncbi:MAG TPA: DsbC family protein [Mariprofundaceae bacterium]|nr:DsbC family protein [Mariprofundaceae bacterium]
MKTLLVLVTLLFPMSCAANETKIAPAGVDKDIRQTLSNMDIKTIQKTPFKGLYEVQAGDQIFYTNSTGQYLLNGQMFDTKTKQNLTAIRLAEVNRISWTELPLENAIVSGPEDGLKMAVFTDPDCPYCVRLEKNLKKETGIRVYTFLFPLIQLHPDAYEKSKSIWCAEDQHQAMLDVMLDKKKLPAATCDTPIDANLELAQKLNVRGTPTIFSEDGRKYTGGNMQAWLEQGK